MKKQCFPKNRIESAQSLMCPNMVPMKTTAKYKYLHSSIDGKIQMLRKLTKNYFMQNLLIKKKYI